MTAPAIDAVGQTDLHRLVEQTLEGRSASLLDLLSGAATFAVLQCETSCQVLALPTHQRGEGTTKGKDTVCIAAKPYLTIDDLAALLQIPKKTIYNWRTQSPKKGPVGFTVGKHTRFRRVDVDAWVESLM
jgi:excisionase family DNA binding protein